MCSLLHLLKRKLLSNILATAFDIIKTGLPNRPTPCPEVLTRQEGAFKSLFPAYFSILESTIISNNNLRLALTASS